MKLATPILSQPAARGRWVALRAFSLIEIMVALGLLTIIVIALFVVFNHIQRAFRASMNQTDLFEAARTVTDSSAREIEQMAPSYLNTLNFYAQLINDTPVVQTLPGIPGSQQVRTNLLQDFFMLTRNNDTWVGIGYCVRTNDSAGRLWLPEITPGSPGQAGIGSLYRFTYSLPVLNTNSATGIVGLPLDPGIIYNAFSNAVLPGSVLMSNRVCDGVIHFRFRAFDTNGWLIVSGSSANTDIRTNSVLAPGEVWRYAFYSNAVPAFVEMELGILEPHAVTRFNSIGAPAAALNYLQRDDVTSRVQLFRQRVAIRNFDPQAFQ